MRIAYRARNADEARNASEALAAAGIPSHVPDPEHAALVPGGQLETVPVLVDNRSLGPAQRALQLWIRENERT